MKYVFIILAIAMGTLPIESCNDCWGYPAKSRFKQVPMEQLDCPCQCEQYVHTVGKNDRYICTQCGHMLTSLQKTNTFHIRTKKQIHKHKKKPARHTPQSGPVRNPDPSLHGDQLYHNSLTNFR